MIDPLQQQSDPEACQSCGAPYAAPECSSCFDDRWTVDAVHPLASVVLNSGATAPNTRR